MSVTVTYAAELVGLIRSGGKSNSMHIPYAEIHMLVQKRNHLLLRARNRLTINDVRAAGERIVSYLEER